MSLMDQIKDWFKTPFDNPTAMSLYRAIVTQSRLPVFFGWYGVSDTPDGRYDLVALHAFLVMRRLKSGGADAVDLAQALHDLMFADMDQNLREMGIGDHGMPKRMKKLVEGFRGRIAAYDNALESGDDAELRAALKRNLYRKTAPSDADVDRMVRYTSMQDRHLAALDGAELLDGKVGFCSPDIPQQSIADRAGEARQ